MKIIKLQSADLKVALKIRVKKWWGRLVHYTGISLQQLTSLYGSLMFLYTCLTTSGHAPNVTTGSWRSTARSGTGSVSPISDLAAPDLDPLCELNMLAKNDFFAIAIQDLFKQFWHFVLRLIKCFYSYCSNVMVTKITKRVSYSFDLITFYYMLVLRLHC